jgi:hypothetical protein
MSQRHTAVPEEPTLRMREDAEAGLRSGFAAEAAALGRGPASVIRGVGGLRKRCAVHRRSGRYVGHS